MGAALTALIANLTIACDGFVDRSYQLDPPICTQLSHTCGHNRPYGNEAIDGEYAFLRKSLGALAPSAAASQMLVLAEEPFSVSGSE